LISLELGFDELEIRRNDSIANADSISGPVLSSIPIDSYPKEVKKNETPVKATPNGTAVVPKKTDQNQESKPKSKAKPKAKTKPKPKPDQAAIDRWKAKVAAQKALSQKSNGQGSTKTGQQ